MKILIPFFLLHGTSTYPDDYQFFTNMERIELNGQAYYACNYTGNKSLAADVTYNDYLASLNPIQIMITEVTGALMSSSDFTHITCSELTNIIVKGNVAVNDRTFSMPIRRDDGRLILFPVTVVNGEFEAVLNFPTSGQYSYSDIEANIDLPPNTFTVAPIKLDVLRQTI